MTPWMIEIKGDPFDIQELFVLNFLPDITVTEEDGRYYLCSEDFNSQTEAREVFNIGIKLVNIINGIAQLEIENWRNITAHDVARNEANGTRSQFVFPEPIVGRSRVSTNATVIHEDGTTEDRRPPSALESELILARNNPEIERALRLYGSREHSWGNLYIIYEVIEADVGGKEAIAAKGWTSKKKIENFKRTANSIGAVGDDARHGSEDTQPPPNPMPLSEAQTLIRSLLRDWVASKL
jgi:hypothetical protein